MNEQNGITPTNQIAERTIADKVINRVAKLTELNQLDLPGDYSAPNALRAAYLQLLETTDKAGRSVLEVCTTESISNAMFNMVIQGLSVAKGQGAFIAYGGKLQFQRMYAGTLALAKRTADVKECNGQVIYKGDEFEYEITPDGRTVITKHGQSLANIDPNGIIGAYATVIYNDGTTDTEILTYDQIKAAWAMNRTANPAQMKFPDQMAIKTAMNRALKVAVNSANDLSVVSGQGPDSDEFDQEEQQDAVLVTSETVIKEEANKVHIDFDDEPQGPVNYPAETTSTSETPF